MRSTDDTKVALCPEVVQMPSMVMPCMLRDIDTATYSPYLTKCWIYGNSIITVANVDILSILKP